MEEIYKPITSVLKVEPLPEKILESFLKDMSCIKGIDSEGKLIIPFVWGLEKLYQPSQTTLYPWDIISGKLNNPYNTIHPKILKNLPMPIIPIANQMVDVYIGRSKQFKYEINTKEGCLYLSEIIENNAGCVTDCANYKLPDGFADVEINHCISTYGLFVTKVPLVNTAGDRRELSNPCLLRKIRKKDGGVIDSVINHLYEDYLYVGRVMTTDLAVSVKSDTVKFMQLIDGDWKLLTVYKLPPSCDTDLFRCEMNKIRDLIVRIPKPMPMELDVNNNPCKVSTDPEGEKEFVIQHEARITNSSYAHPIGNFLKINRVMTFKHLHIAVHRC